MTKETAGFTSGIVLKDGGGSKTEEMFSVFFLFVNHY